MQIQSELDNIIYLNNCLLDIIGVRHGVERSYSERELVQDIEVRVILCPHQPSQQLLRGGGEVVLVQKTEVESGGGQPGALEVTRTTKESKNKAKGEHWEG